MPLPLLSRRGAVLGAVGMVAAATACADNPRPALQCTDVTAAPAVDLSTAEQEMHGILLLLAMALVFDGWGVDRQRPDLLAAYAEAEPDRRFADYLGHNIGALLVDRDNRIICFALNRNVALNSTLEHAEARSVRDAIRIANAQLPPGPKPPWTFGSLLQSDRLYATLEPCAQCAGILELANVGSIVYGQDDPAQHHIVNVLYNLRHQPGESGAPLPIRASFLPVWDDLAGGYRRFLATMPAGGRMGLTSFLQTVDAYRAYRGAAATFAMMQAESPANTVLLREARAFRTRWQGSVAEGLVPI